MGLEVSHDCWSGSYSSFSGWRHEIAMAAGYQVLTVKYNDCPARDCIMLDWGHTEDKNYMGEWDETPADPLHVLFVHCDCEGVIHPEQAGPLADALERLLPSLVESSQRNGVIFPNVFRVRQTEKFISGLRSAVAAGEIVEFF